METNKNLAQSLGEESCFVTRVRATACLSVCKQQEQGRESRNMMETGGTARGQEEEWRRMRRRGWIRGRDEKEQERRNTRGNAGTGRRGTGEGGEEWEEERNRSKEEEEEKNRKRRGTGEGGGKEQKEERGRNRRKGIEEEE